MQLCWAGEPGGPLILQPRKEPPSNNQLYFFNFFGRSYTSDEQTVVKIAQEVQNKILEDHSFADMVKGSTVSSTVKWQHPAAEAKEKLQGDVWYMA